MTELWTQDAAELGRRVANGTVTAREVIEAHLDRISQVNPKLNAIVVPLGEPALRMADGVDRAIAKGEKLGPFAGVPITIKENIDYAGTATTQGVSALADAVPDQNAPIVDRMLAAGAIPIGRTNLPDMALRLHTDSSLHGPTLNPWNSDYTPGGSSGGEAVALATGMSVVGLGNDLGGSLRNPASCCGIATIKPTQGVVPFVATVPSDQMPISFQLMASDGPMARHVADVRLGLNVLAGYHPRDPNSFNAQFTAVDRPLKIAVMAEPPGGTVDPRIADLTRDAGRALEVAGCTVEEASPPDLEGLVELWFRLIANDLSLAFADLQQVMSEDAARGVEDILRDQPAADAASYAEALMLRYSIAREWTSFFGEYDLLLSPTWTSLPFRTGWDLETTGRMTKTLRQARCVMPGNVLGLPSASVPAGLVEGLPVGVLLTGNRFSDHLCLDAAELVERAMGVTTPIDPLMMHRSGDNFGITT